MAVFYEVIVRGDDRDLIPYLTGYAAGSGSSGLHFAQDAGLRVSALRERIKHRGELQHIICPEGDRAKLRDAVKKAAPRFEFEILEESKIERGYFHFEFETPSRKVADALKKILAKLPAGVDAMDYEPEEIVDPGARGAEVYSPAHEYIFRGKGVIEGDVGGVIATRMRLVEIEFAQCGEIDLHRT